MRTYRIVRWFDHARERHYFSVERKWLCFWNGLDKDGDTGYGDEVYDSQEEAMTALCKFKYCEDNQKPQVIYVSGSQPVVRSRWNNETETNEPVYDEPF